MTGLEKHQIYVELFQELFEREPEVAYYVLLYYVNKGMEQIGRDSTNQALRAEVVAKMDQLESLKRSLGDPVPKDTYEGFLTMLFCQVDTEDRQEGSVGPTAKKFRNCAKLIEAWGAIGPIPPAWDSKRKYCMWKAADIIKAIKERRVPRRGGPNDEQSSEPMDVEQNPAPSQPAVQPVFPQAPAGFPQATNHSAYSQAQPDAFPQFPSQPTYPQPTNPSPPTYPQPAYPSQPSPSQPMQTYPMANQQAFRQGYGTKLTREQVRILSQVVKASNNALQEMEFKKIREAKEALSHALQILSTF